MSAIFKPEHVGQVVSHPLYGDGVIIGYDSNDSEYPVKVQFQSTWDTFTKYGHRISNCLPTLQFGPLDNWERRTQPQLQDGQLIEFEVAGGSNFSCWRLARIHIDGEKTFFYTTVTPEGSKVLHPLTQNWRCAL